MKYTTVINDKLYTLIASKLSTPAGHKKFMANIAMFMNQKNKQINDIAPYTNIYYNASDVSKLFASLNMIEKDVLNILKECYFWNQNFRPKCAKEPYVEVLACAIRYYLKAGDMKSAKIVTIYMCFSGKFYASIYSNYWKYPVKDTIMDFVVNNMLSEKFDLRKEGTIFKSIEKLSTTYLEKYKNEFTKELDDEDYAKKIIQQLRDRVKSFLKNIFVMYKYAADNKLYMNYETDSLDPDDFRITNNDAANAARLTEAAVSVFTSQDIDMKICDNCKDTSINIKPSDIKNILLLIRTPENIPKLKRVFNILICSYYGTYKGGSINSPDFIEYAIKTKPNTNNELLIEMKNTVTEWLQLDSEYRRRSNRDATANAYYRCLMLYFALLINKVDR